MLCDRAFTNLVPRVIPSFLGGERRYYPGYEVGLLPAVIVLIFIESIDSRRGIWRKFKKIFWDSRMFSMKPLKPITSYC